MTQYDPLLEAEKLISHISIEQKPKKIKVSRAKIFYTTRPVSMGKKVFGMIQFLCTYILLSGTIFAIMMGAVNFQAYSARISYWLQSDVYAQSREEFAHIGQTETMETMISSDMLVGDRDVIAERIAQKNPEMVYSRAYPASHLLSNVPMESAKNASFTVHPQENRIIIPRLGKNIPLIDVDHDLSTSVDTMHDVFMEELKKGIVRYPGTAKPGEQGNMFIFGHSSNYPWVKSNYNDVFALLDTLENGDEIIVYYHQKKFVYRVNDRAVVKPGDTKVLNSRDANKKEISLMTCWPIGTTLDRLIIFGELVEE